MTHPRICVAVRRQEPVDLVMDEGTVRFEPYEHGFGEDGEEVLVGVVVESDASGWEPGWGRVPVDAIRDVQPTGGSFLPRVGYDLDDAVLPEVHCRLVRHGHGW